MSESAYKRLISLNKHVENLFKIKSKEVDKTKNNIDDKKKT